MVPKSCTVGDFQSTFFFYLPPPENNNDSLGLSPVGNGNRVDEEQREITDHVEIWNKRSCDNVVEEPIGVIGEMKDLVA